MKIKPIKDINDLKDFVKSYFSYLKGDCLTTFSNYTELMELIPPILLQSKRKSYFVMESDNFITLIFYNERKEICPILQPIDKKGRDITYIAQELINEKIYFMIDDRNYSKDILKEYNVRFSRECFIAFDKSIISDDWINSSNEIPKKMRKMLRDTDITMPIYHISEVPENISEAYNAITDEWIADKLNKKVDVSSNTKVYKTLFKKNLLKDIDKSFQIFLIPLMYNDTVISISVVEVWNRKVAVYSGYKTVFRSDTIPPKYINNAGSLKYYIPIKALIDTNLVDDDFILYDGNGSGLLTEEQAYEHLYNKASNSLYAYKSKHNPKYIAPTYVVLGKAQKHSIF